MWRGRTAIYKMCFVLSIIWVLICIFGLIVILGEFSFIPSGTLWVDNSDLTAFGNICIALARLALVLATGQIAIAGLVAIWSICLVITGVKTLIKRRQDKNERNS